MMLASLAWLFSFLSVAAIGVPLVAHPAFRPLRGSGRFALAFGAGASIVSWLMTVSALCGLPWLPVVLGLAGFLVSAALRAVLPTRPSERMTSVHAEGANWITRLSLGAAGLAIAAAYVAAISGRSNSPDLLFFWGAKAQRFATGRTIDSVLLGSPSLGYMHRDYPPLLTNLYAWASLLSGRLSWQGATLCFGTLLLLTYLMVRRVFRTSLDARAAEPLAALLVCSLAVIGILTMFGGIGEMPLLFFEVGGLALLCCPALDQSAAQLAAGMLLGGAACTKVEGVVVAVGATLAWFLVRAAGQPLLKGLVSLTGPTLLSLGTWFLYGRLQNVFSLYRESGPLEHIHWSRLPFVLGRMSLGLWAVWFGLPYLLPAVSLVIARRWRKTASIPLLSGAALIAFLIFTYLHGDASPEEWIDWSTARVLSPLPALFVLGLVSSWPHEEPAVG